MSNLKAYTLCGILPTMSTSNFVNSHLVNVDKVDKQEIWTYWEIVIVGIDKVGIWQLDWPNESWQYGS